MIKIGMIIGDRYEILEKIGTGGMSDVYKAKCHKLNRFVAVKVLKQEFSENANFVSKFRVEAQAAAGLMHPNIVNVYDVGEENGNYYIVMELVEGITLKKYIEKKARLSYKEAVSVAIQVSMGIDAAHNNHIIHRDIKPQNIIISREGKVKVTDFGIAKAATSNTITSNVMGSVHYTSPEQARGGYSDEKSDIYSLGITMYEMLTGRVPFNGETTVAIAIKHIQEEMPTPRELVPEIPESVESIVMKCCQKSPERRYQNMQELVADLKQSLISPDENFVIQAEPDMDGDTRMITEGEVAQIKQMTAYQEEPAGEEEGMRLLSETEAMYEDEDAAEYGDEYDYNPKMEKLNIFLAIVAVVAILLIIVVLVLVIGGGNKEPENPSSEGMFGQNTSDVSDSSAAGDEAKPVKMPAVAGKYVEDAVNQLADLGIIVKVERETSDVVEAGLVISADVTENSDILPGSTVNLVASIGPKAIEMPPVTGDSFEAASRTLKDDFGFQQVVRQDEYNETVQAGIVTAQLPTAGSLAERDTNIILTVSLGKEMTKVPNLLGLTEEEGRMALVEEHLQPGDEISYVYSDKYARGLICSQSYSHMTSVELDTKIDFSVSQGPQPKETYQYSGSIEAPTLTEDPDYKAGTPVELKLVADDGMSLLETTVTSFPYSVKYMGLQSSGGMLTMTYTVTSASTTETDENGNQVTIPGQKQEKTLTRRIEFTAE